MPRETVPATKVLALDTSTRSGSLALLEGEKLVAELGLLSSDNHAERLLRGIDYLLAGAALRLAQGEGAVAAVPRGARSRRRRAAPGSGGRRRGALQSRARDLTFRRPATHPLRPLPGGRHRAPRARAEAFLARWGVSQGRAALHTA